MTKAYYNEHDPFAAAWLRELIKEGLIADGYVDERDIRDVTADDLRGFTQCHFFAGIGGWPYALRLAGWPDSRPVWTGSCPCQPFSTAGKRAGAADERHLWPSFHWLIRQSRPLTVFGEQVESKDGRAWLAVVQADLEGSGYRVGAVAAPAAGFGAPHARHRLYWVAESNEHECRQERADAGGCQEGSRAEGLGKRLVHGGNGHGVADAAEERRQHELEITGSDRAVAGETECWVGVGCGSSDGHGLADSEHAQRGAEQQKNGNAHRRDGLGWSGDTGGSVGHPDNARSQGRSVSGATGGGDGAGERLTQEASPWSDLEWLPCRDNRLRPTQPGLFPLAHGIPNRVGRLRGYGNAIVPQVAQAFIEAYLEVSQ